MKKIPVIFSTDNNYAVPTCVTIVSMLENKNVDTFYEITVIVTNDFTEAIKEIFYNLKKKYNNFSVDFMVIKPELFNKTESKIGHISNVAFYRLAIADLFSYEKCIYMDSDVIVLDDLEEIYDIDLTDFYIASVKNYRHNQKCTSSEKHRQMLDIPSLTGYVCGAPLVMNLTKIRDDFMTEKFMSEIKKGYPTGDQDVINKCCYNHIYHLPLKTNLLSRFIGLEMLLDKDNIYTEKERREAAERPLIIHYGGRIEKPWLNRRCKGFDLWWKYADTIKMETSKFISYDNEMNSFDRMISRKKLISLIKENNIICIWGATKFAEEITEYILQYPQKKIVLVDNSALKVGTKIKDITIVSGNVFLEKKGHEDILFVITPQVHYRDILVQLKSYKIPGDKIFNPIYKNAEYYMTLDPKYKNEEIKEILEWESIAEHTLSNQKYRERYNLGLWYDDVPNGVLE